MARSGCSPEQLPLIGVLAEHLHRRGHLIAGGVRSRQQQAAREHPQFGGIEAVPVVLGADQVGEQVIGQGVPAMGDHVVDVVVEFAPGPHDGGLELSNVGGEGEGFEDVVRPRRELLPVFAGRAEQRADDGDGVGPREVGDDVTAPGIDDLVDEIVHHADHRLMQARNRSGGERLGTQTA